MFTIKLIAYVHSQDLFMLKFYFWLLRCLRQTDSDSQGGSKGVERDGWGILRGGTILQWMRPFFLLIITSKCPIKTTTWVRSDTTYSSGSGGVMGSGIFGARQTKFKCCNNNNNNGRRTRKYAQVAGGEHEKFVYLKLAEHKRKAFKWTFHIPSTLWPQTNGVVAGLKKLIIILVSIFEIY